MDLDRLPQGRRTSLHVAFVVLACALIVSTLWVGSMSRQECVAPGELNLDATLRYTGAAECSTCEYITQGSDSNSIVWCGWFMDPQGNESAEGSGPAIAAPFPLPSHLPSNLLGGRQLLPGHPRECQCASCVQCAPQKVITGVDSTDCVGCGEPTWSMRGPIPWEVFAHGEYVGPHRNPHVNEYRLRVDDELEIIYRLTRERAGRPYELAVGDQVRIESIADRDLNRDLEVQPDGSITLPLAGQVMAAGRTTDQIRRDLELRFKKFYKDPTITVTPVRVNTKLEDLRATVDSRQGQGGQSRLARVTPDGTVSLAAIGPAPAQGLTLLEFQQELNARYASMFDGIEVIPVLTRRAPRFIYVVGDVTEPGRFELVGPTTVIQAIALAQGPNVGANLRQIVVFRRANDWRLLATKVDVRGALYGQRPAPSDELWLRDSDVVIVPKSPIKTVTDAIGLVATNGVYAAAPFLQNIFFSNSSTVVTTATGATVNP